MATIREWIIKGTLKAAEDRLEKLKEISAPQVVIDGQSRYVDSLKKGSLKISGDKSLLDVEYIHSEQKKGRGGRIYYTINDSINFFPNAKYGMYISAVDGMYIKER